MKQKGESVAASPEYPKQLMQFVNCLHGAVDMPGQQCSAILVGHKLEYASHDPVKVKQFALLEMADRLLPVSRASDKDGTGGGVDVVGEAALAFDAGGGESNDGMAAASASSLVGDAAGHTDADDEAGGVGASERL